MDKLIKVIIGAIIALVAGLFGWTARGKKENKRHAKHQKVIVALDKRLREVETELADVKTLSKAKITQLRNERDKLVKNIDKEKRKAA